MSCLAVSQGRKSGPDFPGNPGRLAGDGVPSPRIADWPDRGRNFFDALRQTPRAFSFGAPLFESHL